MHINEGIFRQYDIRGVADIDLTPEMVVLLGNILGEYFEQHGRDTVLVGRDNRLSSARIRDHLLRGLLAAGMKIHDIGTVTSPMLYYARHLYNLDAGVMITASHNPPEYNGFKIALGHATIYGDEIQKVKKMMMEKAPGSGVCLIDEIAAGSEWNRPTANDSRIKVSDPSSNYMNTLVTKLQLGDRKLKVAVDCGNGTTSMFACEFLSRLGCEVVPLYCESDPTFPNHHPDPVDADNLRDLRTLVLESRADLGIGFDGDGDRLGAVDDRGNVVWGDQLMVIYWEEILKKHPGAEAIIEVKCSQALVDEVQRMGGRPFFYKTGHSLIKAKMKEIGAVFTGEMSGHMFFADEYYGFDDAFYAAGRLLRILSRRQESLSELISRIPKYYATAETRIPCSDEDKFAVVADFTARMQEQYEVVDVDGARVLFPNGWGLARCSNTQPVIVARCEGKTPEALEEICRIMRENLTAYPQVGTFDWR